MLCQLIHKNSSNICYKCGKTAWNVTFWTKKNVKEKDSDLKIRSPVGQIDRKNRKKKIKLLLPWFAKSFTKNSPTCAGNVPILSKMSLFEPRKKSQKVDGDLKNCPPIGQIDHKNKKKKIKLLLKWFANSFRKHSPICTWTVPELPKMSLFEPRQKSQKRMATSRFALQ